MSSPIDDHHHLREYIQYRQDDAERSLVIVTSMFAHQFADTLIDEITLGPTFARHCQLGVIARATKICTLKLYSGQATIRTWRSS